MSDKDEYKIIINGLDDLLRFGRGEIRSVKINISTQREKTVLLFSIMGNIDENCRAVVALIKNGNIFPATGMLRTLLESYIKLMYIFKDNTQQNAKRFLFKSFHEKLSWLNNMKRFFGCNPDFDGGLFTEINWNEEINKTKKIIKDQEKKYPFLSVKMTNLYEVSKKCDEGTGANKTEFLYLSTYKYFSEHLHSGAVGLDAYFRPNDDKSGYWFDPQGSHDNIPMIIHTAQAIYLDAIKVYFKYFKIRKIRELKKHHPKFKEVG